MYFSIFLCVSKDEIEQSDHYCILFGESMSKITRKEQMDIFVRFWSKSTNDVDIMDFKSLFLGHTIVNDLLNISSYSGWAQCQLEILLIAIIRRNF